MRELRGSPRTYGGRDTRATKTRTRARLTHGRPTPAALWTAWPAPASGEHRSWDLASARNDERRFCCQGMAPADRVGGGLETPGFPPSRLSPHGSSLTCMDTPRRTTSVICLVSSASTPPPPPAAAHSSSSVAAVAVAGGCEVGSPGEEGEGGGSGSSANRCVFSPARISQVGASEWSCREAAGGIPESAREPVSGIPSWACGHAR
jgi:hypothetical protein